jgi:stress-induced morphogen
MFSADELKSRIEQAFPNAQVKVTDLTGTQDHYQVDVISEKFSGVSPIERHRKVYSLFGDVIGGALHALSLKLKAPTE